MSQAEETIGAAIKTVLVLGMIWAIIFALGNHIDHTSDPKPTPTSTARP